MHAALEEVPRYMAGTPILRARACVRLRVRPRVHKQILEDDSDEELEEEEGGLEGGKQARSKQEEEEEHVEDVKAAKDAAREAVRREEDDQQRLLLLAQGPTSGGEAGSEVRGGTLRGGPGTPQSV